MFLCHTPITRPAACASGRRDAGRSRRTPSRCGSSARRGGQEEARFVNLARQASAWLLGDVAEREKSSSVAGVLVLICFFSCVWLRDMSHRDKVVDVTVGRSIARFASEQQDCERANLDQPGHHLREKHPEWNVDILETFTRTKQFVLWCLTGVHSALDRPDLPHAAAVALWSALLVNLAHVARQSLFSLRSTQECGWSLASATSSDRLSCD